MVRATTRPPSCVLLIDRHMSLACPLGRQHRPSPGARVRRALARQGNASRGRRHDMYPTGRAPSVTRRLACAGLVAASVIAAGVLPAAAATAAPAGPPRTPLGQNKTNAPSARAPPRGAPPTPAAGGPEG